MDNNSNTEQPKLVLQKATYSLTLGIISIILPFVIMAIQGSGMNYGPEVLLLLGMIVAGICAILGLTFGIKGLKSTRRKLAIAGIVVCGIGLLYWIWNFPIWFAMSHH